MANLMLSVLCTITILYTIMNFVSGAIEPDEVKSLPGYNGTLPSKQYSGYLKIPNVSPNRYYHYWLVLSENDPSTDPIVFWFNGM